MKVQSPLRHKETRSFRREIYAVDRIARPSRRYGFALLVLAAFIGNSCGAHSVELATHMRPESLFMKDHPYGRLYIEIDTVEGVEVPQDWLDHLETFFAEHACKPDGIVIAKDEPIPLAEVRDLTVTEASLLYTDGPRETEEQPAYVHVFFYNLDDGLSAPYETPHVLQPYPNTIFFNMGYQDSVPSCIGRDYLLHEAGHVLGLCRNKNHGDGSHCRNYNCLMRASTEELSSLARILGTPLGIEFAPVPPCKDCLGDLEFYKRADLDAGLSFNGPFLVRRQEKYSVVSLPSCNIIVEPNRVLDWRNALQSAKTSMMKSVAKRRDTAEAAARRGESLVAPETTRKAPKKGLGNNYFFMSVRNGDAPSPAAMERVMAILTAAAEDPNPFVSLSARVVLKQQAGDASTQAKP